MKPIHSCVSRFILVMLGIWLPLLVLEGGVRVLKLAPPVGPQPDLWAPHPELGWFHVPHRGGLWYSEYNEFQAQVHINARGLRDREIGYDNPERAFRILVLGDPFAEALQVSLEATFAKQLEGLLSTANRRVEVINAGVGGWGTDQEGVFYATEGFRYQPDLVVVCFFTHNDTLNNFQPLEVARTHGAVQKPFFELENGVLVEPHFPFEAPPAPPVASPPLLPVYHFLHDRLALVRLLAPYLRDIPLMLHTLGPSGLLGGMAAFMAADPTTPLSYAVYLPDAPPEWEAAWQLTEALLRRLKVEVTARHARLAVVIIGAPEQVYPDRWTAVVTANPVMQGQVWVLETPNRRLATLLTSADIPYLDLLPVFRSAAARADAPVLHFRRDGHWTMAGHQLAAQTIATFLREQQLVPAP